METGLPVSDLESRVQRISAAINAVADPDLSNVKVTRRPGVSFSVNLELPQEQLENLAHSAIHNVASLHDHLRGHARRHGQDPDRVNAAVQASLALQVILDLDDRDKHGGDRRDGGRSGRNPRLGELFRGMRMMPTTPGVASEITFTSEGLPIPHRLLPPRVEVNGPVLDGGGMRIGDLLVLLEAAVSAWEVLLTDLRTTTETKRDHPGGTGTAL